MRHTPYSLVALQSEPICITKLKQEQNNHGLHIHDDNNSIERNSLQNINKEIYSQQLSDQSKAQEILNRNLASNFTNQNQSRMQSEEPQRGDELNKAGMIQMIGEYLTDKIHYFMSDHYGQLETKQTMESEDQ
ncbi:UNKNOWN [Stylonychia lemnae]|uniref:Uncharacterized protein n=1 Tax=Stylonychia lemnae TaxID=5949 RepID=A0A077ZUQ4_STYLE|nr:UNKNOWN [Stylonychia lemnae]|eukprot:CDW73035.1 UNKNOWN [Stylonychia lemnae]